MSAEKYNYAIIQNIIEFYRLQPGVKDCDLDKLEEYMVLIGSFSSEAFNDLNEINNSKVIDNYEDIVGVLNRYINLVLEEMNKIFPNKIINISPLLSDEQFDLNEIQIIEYYKRINKGEQDKMRLSEQLQLLENSLFDKDFGEKLADITLMTIKRINSDLMIRMEDLM